MSLPQLARYLQLHGRGEDTMLIHMTPNEISGLQALAEHHGGSLTVNPNTGLPEAGFLSSILPVLAGAAVSMIPGVGPILAPLAVGTIGGLATGSLSKGLKMGLGALGGAGIAGGLAKLGSGALGAGLASAETAGALNAARAASAVPNMAFQTGQQFMGGAGTAIGNQAAQQVARQALTPTNIANGFMQNMSNVGTGVQRAFQNPGQFVDAMGGVGKTAMYGGAALAPAMLSTPDNRIPGSRQPSSLAPLAPNFYQNPMYSGEPLTTRQFSSGGMTTGPGDGMSDQIPATINGQQPATLSPDEFVVPADVVSHIGNGSSQAGAQKLYAMLDRIRQSRTGSVEQAPSINAERMMPV